MKNVLLVICPPVWHKLPPLGLAYISEYLKFCGHCVDVVDLNVENISVEDKARDYDWIGFSVFKTNQHETLQLAKKIKNKYPRKKIILGGPQCFSWQFDELPDDTKYADSIISGDVIQSLNETPFPTFSRFKLEKYERKRALPILASRGCIRACRFCSEKLLSKGYETRDPKNILEEIRYHKKVNKTKWFTFHDSLINGDLRHLENLCDLLVDEGIVWDAQAVIRKDMTEELLKKMKKSGCFNLFIGMESGSDRVLKLMQKGFTIKDAEGFFKKCNASELHFEVSFITGFPGEGEEEFNETINFIRRNREYIPKIAQINPFIKYTGTDVEQVPLRNGIKKVDRMIKTIEELGIKYTPEFINNLL